MSRLPKYSFVILAVQGIGMIACIVLLILDEYRLYMYLFPPLMVSLAIQSYRLMRARHQLDREYVQILQATAIRRHQEELLHEPQHDMGDALKGLRDEIDKHHKVNKKEV